MLALGPLQALLPVLKALGIDPAKIANKFAKDQASTRMNAGIAAVVARLEKDGVTPALKAASPEGERQFIRSAMYLLGKEMFKILPKGANVVADLLRDQHDDQVVARVSPQIDASTSTEAAVRLVAREYVEHVF